MLTLLRKDYLLNRKALAGTYTLWSVLWLAYPVFRPDPPTQYHQWLGMLSLACAFLPVMMVGREDKFKASALACSLPVTRNTIVASQYVGAWLTAAGGLAVAVLCRELLSLAGLGGVTPPSPDAFLLAAVTVGIALAMLLPFTLRFGIWGVLGFLVAAQMLGIVVLLASAVFGRRLAVGATIRRAADWLSGVQADVGPFVFVVMMLGAVALLDLASCWLASWVYRRREF